MLSTPPITPTPPSPIVLFSEAFSEDPAAAARKIANDLGDECQCALFFTSTHTDLPSLAQHLNDALPCPAVGCTTAGEIIRGTGYTEGRVVAVGFPSPELTFEARLLSPLTDFCRDPRPFLADIPPPPPGKKRFLFLLLDGLSSLEEQALSCISQHFPTYPILGGSAGDDLRFSATYVYFQGEFHPTSGLILFFDTSFDFEILHLQNITPTEHRLVITEADASRRIVYEINGYPAALEYARLLNVLPAQLSFDLFAANPLVLQVADRFFIRSIQKVNPDHSISFYSAIERGLVLRLAKTHPLLPSLAADLSALRTRFHSLHLLLAADCILRKQQLLRSGDILRANAILRDLPILGFSTYGEQIDGLHVNQTLTAVAIGSLNPPHP